MREIVFQAFWKMCLFGTLWSLIGCHGSGFRSVDQISNDHNGSLVEPTPTMTPPPTATPTPTLTPSPTPTPVVAASGKPTGGRGGVRGVSEGQCQDGRSYLIIAPPGYTDSEALPLVVGLHGAGDSYQNFAQTISGVGWKNLAENERFLLLVPGHMNETRSSFVHFNSDRTLNQSATQQEGRSLLTCIYRSIGLRYNIETTQIYWVGFSEGASFSTYMANFLSKEIRAMAIYAGSAPRIMADGNRKIPLYFLTGNLDFNYEPIVQQTLDWNSHATQRDFVTASHSFSQLNSIRAPSVIWSWLKSSQAEPVQSGF